MKTTLGPVFAAAILPACVLLAAQNLPAQDTEIHVLCSNGIRAAVEKLLPNYEHTLGRKINVQYGPSAVFKKSIDGGEQFDLVIITPQLIEELVKEGKVAPGTETKIASTGNGIAVRSGSPKPDVSTPDAIKKLLLNAKSIGYVQVGAGTPAIIALLKGLGIQDAVQSKTAYQSGAEESMKNLAAGKVDVTFALISEIMPYPGVQLAGPIPAEYQRPVTMAAGISSSTHNRDAAQTIIRGLTSADAAKTIKAAGLDPVAPHE